MNCKKSRELILTDYLDDQMDEEGKMRIEEHLARCQSCKKFFLTAKKTADELFADAERTAPPEYIWRRVKETILAAERKKAAPTGSLFERLKAFLYIPRPVLAVATIIILILAIGTMAGIRVSNREALHTGIQEQIEYLDYLAGASGDVLMDDNAGFGTPVEKYFL